MTSTKHLCWPRYGLNLELFMKGYGVLSAERPAWRVTVNTEEVWS